jgi:hypothetical protein
MNVGFQVKYPLFLCDFNEILIFSTYFSKKKTHIKFHKNPSSESGDVPCGRTDMTHLTIAFRNFAKAPNKNSNHNTENVITIWHTVTFRITGREKIHVGFPGAS